MQRKSVQICLQLILYFHTYDFYQHKLIEIHISGYRNVIVIVDSFVWVTTIKVLKSLKKVFQKQH